MVCIYCGNPTKVVNSRKTVRANQTWRRRECTACNAIFTTTETADFSATFVVRKGDGSLSPFSSETLFISLYESLRHRNAPASDASELYKTVLACLIKAQQNKATPGIVPISVIKQIVLNVLQRFDKAAASYYSAYHPGL